LSPIITLITGNQRCYNLSIFFLGRWECLNSIFLHHKSLFISLYKYKNLTNYIDWRLFLSSNHFQNLIIVYNHTCISCTFWCTYVTIDILMYNKYTAYWYYDNRIHNIIILSTILIYHSSARNITVEDMNILLQTSGNIYIDT